MNIFVVKSDGLILQKLKPLSYSFVISVITFQEFSQPKPRMGLNIHTHNI
jgi:hypothetical protein